MKFFQIVCTILGYPGLLLKFRIIKSLKESQKNKIEKKMGLCLNDETLTHLLRKASHEKATRNGKFFL
jgi:hypothetical protein